MMSDVIAPAYFSFVETTREKHTHAVRVCGSSGSADFSEIRFPRSSFSQEEYADRKQGNTQVFYCCF